MRRSARPSASPPGSSLYQINPRADNTLLTAFKSKLERLYIFQPDPWTMNGKSEREEFSPEPDLSNFASWYRHLLQEKSREMNRLQEDLKGVFGKSFDGLRLVAQGDNRNLVADFLVGSSARPITCDFRELSEGQRILVGLYTLVHAMNGEDGSCQRF